MKVVVRCERCRKRNYWENDPAVSWRPCSKCGEQIEIRMRVDNDGYRLHDNEPDPPRERFIEKLGT